MHVLANERRAAPHIGIDYHEDFGPSFHFPKKSLPERQQLHHKANVRVAN